MGTHGISTAEVGSGGSTSVSSPLAHTAGTVAFRRIHDYRWFWRQEPLAQLPDFVVNISRTRPGKRYANEENRISRRTELAVLPDLHGLDQQFCASARIADSHRLVEILGVPVELAVLERIGTPTSRHSGHRFRDITHALVFRIPGIEGLDG